MAQFHNGFALLIGIANYTHFPKLPSAILHDAAELHTTLTNPICCGYPSQQVRRLTDDLATAEGIRNGLWWLAEETTSADTAILFFSGHGCRTTTIDTSRSYLLPVDASPTSLSTRAIESVELTERLAQIQAGRLVILFDCCNAGGTGELKGKGDDGPLPGLESGLSERAYERLSEGKGRVIIASSRADEASTVLPGMANSLFTHFLLAGLRGAAYTREEGLLRIAELFDYLSEQVRAHSHWQHPIFKAKYEDNFPIAFAPPTQPGAAKKIADSPPDESGRVVYQAGGNIYADIKHLHIGDSYSAEQMVINQGDVPENDP